AHKCKACKGDKDHEDGRERTQYKSCEDRINRKTAGRARAAETARTAWAPTTAKAGADARAARGGTKTASPCGRRRRVAGSAHLTAARRPTDGHRPRPRQPRDDRRTTTRRSPTAA